MLAVPFRWEGNKVARVGLHEGLQESCFGESLNPIGNTYKPTKETIFHTTAKSIINLRRVQ